MFQKYSGVKSMKESEPILQFKGLNGHIYLFEDYLDINRLIIHKALRNKLSGNYSLPLSRISEIHFRRASSLKKGYIRFIEIGKDASYLSFLTMDRDDGTVTITKNSNDFVIRFLIRILELKPSIDVLDLGNSEINGQNKVIVDKVIDVVKSGQSFATGKIKEVDKDKLTSDIYKAGINVGVAALKKKYNIK